MASVIDNADNEEAQEEQKGFDKPTRFFEVDFGLEDPHKGSKSFEFMLMLIDFKYLNNEKTDAYIGEFEVLESNCPQIPVGSKNSYFMNNDVLKAYVKDASQNMRDFIGSTLGKKRTEQFSVPKRIKELLGLSAKEEILDEAIVLSLKLTRENYTKGPKAKDPGGPGYKIKYVWELVGE